MLTAIECYEIPISAPKSFQQHETFKQNTYIFFHIWKVWIISKIRSKKYGRWCLLSDKSISALFVTLAKDLVAILCH